MRILACKQSVANSNAYPAQLDSHRIVHYVRQGFTLSSSADLAHDGCLAHVFMAASVALDLMLRQPHPSGQALGHLGGVLLHAGIRECSAAL